METYAPTREEALEPVRTEGDADRVPTADPHDPPKPEPPAGEEPVTPYDHLWFERRPLS